MPDLRTPSEWEQECGFRIVDADGWRVKGAPSWETPITREEFLTRSLISTVQRMRETVDA